jgi:hypothetical protein
MRRWDYGEGRVGRWDATMRRRAGKDHAIALGTKPHSPGAVGDTAHPFLALAVEGKDDRFVSRNLTPVVLRFTDWRSWRSVPAWSRIGFAPTSLSAGTVKE